MDTRGVKAIGNQACKGTGRYMEVCLESNGTSRTNRVAG